MGISLFKMMKSDIQAVFERDPAARSTLEVILCYPGLHAVWGYRLAHWLWTHRLKLFGRLVSHLVRGLTGVEIHPGAKICPSLFIDHGMGVVIGETAEIGCNVTMYHGVTLGGVSLNKGKRHPTIQDNVVIGAGAKILGAITIGEGSRIGANAVVVKDVPPNSVVVGVPGQVVVRSQPRPTAPDLNHDKLPDTIGTALAAVISRLEELEHKLEEYSSAQPMLVTQGEWMGLAEGAGNNGSHVRQTLPHAPDHGLWRGEDFMI
ncbi:MAG: serine O-acetyltransferase [Anaerolineales bacterium]